MSFWVAKFGGSSIRDAQAMKSCALVVKQRPEVGLVVISATYKTTNQLEKMAQMAWRGEDTNAYFLLKECTERHLQIGRGLGAGTVELGLVEEIGFEAKALLISMLKSDDRNLALMDSLYAIGERWSSLLFYWALLECFDEKRVLLKDACQFIKTNSQFGLANPKLKEIQFYCQGELKAALQKSLVVTQGFIGSDDQMRTTTLGREGSDYTATLLACALQANGVQIWTDVPGIFSSDPKLVESSQVIKQLNYEEAYWMAEMGAKILFPKTLDPVRFLGVPVFVGCSQKPELGGTLISKQKRGRGPLALCLKEEKGQVLLSVVGEGLDQIAIDLPEVGREKYYRCFKVDREDAVEELKRWHWNLFERL